jgi:hypothetical protein
MIVTMAVELAMFVYVIYRYKLNTLTRLVAGILVLLAIFQLAEFNVCGGNQPEIFMHVGFMAITLLPALGLHLILKIAKKSFMPLLATTYIVSAGFAVIFGLHESAFLNHVCGGNYAIFTLANGLGGYFFAYYYALLFIGTGLSLYFAHSAKGQVRKALLIQVFGYMSFLLPTGIVNTLNPDTLDAIPSIMCGFAVLYALTLVFGIVPIVSSKKSY